MEAKCLAQCHTSTLVTQLLSSAQQKPQPWRVCHDKLPIFSFSRKLQAKRSRGSLRTHPNFFWPGHLLDKLQLYLPTVAMDRSLALFSCVQPQPHAYSATYHPNHWWPIGNMNYMTCAYYDASKVYYID